MQVPQIRAYTELFSQNMDSEGTGLFQDILCGIPEILYLNIPVLKGIFFLNAVLIR